MLGCNTDHSNPASKAKIACPFGTHDRKIFKFCANVHGPKTESSRIMVIIAKFSSNEDEIL